MDFLNRMTKVIEYIEAHLTEDFDLQAVAAIVNCNAHQFGRIFSYVVGLSLAEYVRNRRLSLAALELADQPELKVIDTALKYGYSSPESFARAFRELHGVSPRQAAAAGVKLRMYPRLTFHIAIQGDTEMEYRIVDREVIRGVGVVKSFGKWKANDQAEHWQERSGEVWRFWDEFLDAGANLTLRDKYKLYRPPFWQMGVNYTDLEGNLTVMIGAEDAEGEYPELTRFEVPASRWAVFTAQGTLNQWTHPVERVLTQIFTEWLPSSGYEQSMPYQIEVYGPGNTQKEDYSVDIWIPIWKK